MAFRAPVLCLGDITFTLLSNATMHDIIPRRPTAPSVVPHTDQCLKLPMLWLAEDLFSRNRERHWLLQEVHQALLWSGQQEPQRLHPLARGETGGDTTRGTCPRIVNLVSWQRSASSLKRTGFVGLGPIALDPISPSLRCARACQKHDPFLGVPRDWQS